MTTADDRSAEAGSASDADAAGADRPNTDPSPGGGPNPGPSADPETAPLGGSEASEDDLEADNPVEEDTLKTLEGGAPTG